MEALLDVDPITLLEFTPELPCEGESHSRGILGHQPDSPAAFIIMSPCCRKRIAHCAGRVAAMRFRGLLTCTACKLEHLIEDYTILPI